MYRWPALLAALLLILSLPIRLAGAATLSCAKETGSGPMRYVHRVELQYGEIVRQSESPIAGTGPVGSSMCITHVASPCGICVSCPIGAIEASPSFAPPGDRAFVRLTVDASSDSKPSFLTEGIERPPRVRLA